MSNYCDIFQSLNSVKRHVCPLSQIYDGPRTALKLALKLIVLFTFAISVLHASLVLLLIFIGLFHSDVLRSIRQRHAIKLLLVFAAQHAFSLLIQINPLAIRTI